MIVALFNTIRRWHNDRRAIQALALMSDERLNDIGLSRGSLERAVRYGLRG